MRVAPAIALSLFAAPAPAATPFVQETVDANGSVGYYTSLALDPQGNPHISYYDATNLDLKYASKSGGVWTIETVPDPSANVGQYTSLVFDV